MLKKTLNLLGDRWPYILMFIASVGLTSILFGYKLTTLVNGISSSEIEMASQIGFKKIIENPLDLPYKLAALSFSKIFNVFTALRIASALYGALSIWFFYVVLRSWHTRRIAILGTLLFGSSTWLLHSARTGDSSIALLSALALLAYGSWAIKTRKFILSLGLALAVFALNIYVPGLIWFVGAAIVWQFRRIVYIFSRVSLVYRIVSLFLLGALLAPLLYGFSSNPALIRTWLGLPHTLPDVYSYFNNLIRLPIDLYIRFDGPADVWLSGVPLLDIFGGTMLLLGIYTYFFKIKLDRAKLILGGILMSALLVALGGVYVVVIMPYLHLAMTAGFTLMIQQWFTVFPRNPLARGLALSLIIISLTLSTFYQLNRYFIAWPNAPGTKASFVQDAAN